MTSFVEVLYTCTLLIVPQPCFDEFFVKFNFFNVDCLKVVLSKCLGYGIILGSVLVKVPQIVKLVTAKSGEGISLLSVTLELVAISGTLAYGYANAYPFSSYGESGFLAIQTVAIAFLVLLFTGRGILGFLYIAIYGGITAYLMSGAAPMSLLTALQASVMPIVIAAKGIQAAENFRNSSTGQLSAITVFLLFLGSVARVFTSIQETGDNIIILTYIISTTFNGLIAAQMVYYWNVKPKPKQE